MEAWVYPTANIASGVIAHKDGQYSFVRFAGGTLGWADSSNWCYACFGMYGDVPLNTWTHVAAVKSGSTVTLYINGAVVVQKTFGGALTSTNNITHIGCYSGATTCSLGYYFPGRLDEVAIYDRVLSASEIAVHVAQGVNNDDLGDACDPCPLNANAACLPTSCSDQDGDGYGLLGASACSAGQPTQLDCDDADPLKHPGVVEACDGIDNDCDGVRDRGCTALHCADDVDCDGVRDDEDNCPMVANTTQTDSEAVAPGSNPPLLNGVAVYRFEETSGTTAQDSAGASPGTLMNGAVRGAGVGGGRAVWLDGVDDHVRLANTSALNLTGTAISVEAWVHPTGGNATIVHKDAQYSLTRYANGALTWADSSNWNYAAFGAYGNVPDNKWTHVAVTKSGSTVTLYVNGFAVVAKEFGGVLTGTSNTAHIGCYAAASSCVANRFKGGLDEVVVYNRALSASEAEEHAAWAMHGDGIGDACDACATSANVSCVPTTCADDDGDGYGTQGASACGAGHEAQFDCNPTDATVYPGAVETCDGLDNDCNGRSDEGCPARVTVRYEYADQGDSRWTAIQGRTFGRLERAFSSSGRLASWVEPNGDESTRLYDAAGRVQEEVDALGNRTVYGYDAAGRLQGITDVALAATTAFVRDSAGRVTRTVDALGNETTTSYKLGGRLKDTTNARGFTTAFDRDPTSSAITDALTRTTVTSLTALGLPTSTSYPGGASTSSAYAGTTRLDASQSFPTSFNDELQRARTFGYDPNSGLTSTTDLAGKSWSYTYGASKGSAISYDVFSGDTGLSHHQGGAQAYAGGGGGTEYRDVRMVGGGGGDGAFVHHLDSVTSPMGQTTRFVRGDNGRIERVEYPDGGVKRISYDASAQPATVVLPQGTALSFQHDAALRETSRVSSTGEMRAFTYGPNDRIETMTDATGTTDYVYDASGRFVGIVYPHGGSVTYTRDKLDRVRAVRVKATATASEIVTGYAYDANGNLKTVTDPLGGVTTMVYDSVDRLVEKHLPNGVVSTYTYDDRDRVLSVTHTGASGVLASVTYVRSASGEPTRITREDGSYVVLTYDAALRLDTETYYTEGGAVVDAIDYDYDFDGNRTRKTSLTGGVEDYGYSAGFRLNSVTKSSGTDTFGYDGGGRVTSIARDGGTQTLTYNSDDKVTRVVGGATEVQYTYDGVGRRVAKLEGGVTTRYLVAPNLGDGFETPQAVTDASGNVLASYVFSGEQPLMRIENGVATYYLQDAMGSVVGMANSAGSSVASIKYDGFGNVTSSTGSAAAINPTVGWDFRLHGMALDAASGLYHVRARTYDPRTGRFTTRDPFFGVRQMPETYQAYGFGNSNPFLFVDPTGNFSLVEMSVTVGIVGIMAATALPSYSSYLRRARAARDGSRIASGSPFAAGAVQSILQDLGSFGLLQDPNAQLPSYYLDALQSALAWNAVKGFVTQGYFSAGAEAGFAIVSPLESTGTIRAVNIQSFATTDTDNGSQFANLYCVSDAGLEQHALDISAGVKGVVAFGHGAWTGPFTSLLLGPVFSIFWSPEFGPQGEGWIGYTMGLGVSLPFMQGSYGLERTLYENCNP